MTLAEMYRGQVSKIRDDNRHIAAHAILEYAYEEAVRRNPKTIVEIGTGIRGIRTRVICFAAAVANADHVSVDIKDCRYCGNDWNRKWRFVQADGRDFAITWPGYARSLGISEKIDFLVIDADEKYDTTSDIWKRWSPFLSPACSVLFRCTNLRQTLVYRDGSTTSKGWDNNRGVARVVEEILGGPIDERAEWSGNLAGWGVSHYPWGAGLTILRREG